MYKSIALACAAALVASLATVSSAAAQNHTQPGVRLSPNLAEPWTLQLQHRQPAHSVQYRQHRQAQGQIVYRQSAHQHVYRPQPKQQVTGIFRLFNQPRAQHQQYRHVTTVAHAPATQRHSVSSSRTTQAAASIATQQARYQIKPQFLPTVVPYAGKHRAGTVIVNTNERYLYLVQNDGTARRYGVGVGRPGFEWAGTHKVTRKSEWPDWRPPAAMRKRQPDLPAFMPGGPQNPMGARALYLGSTLYRIHGSNEPWTIGSAVSSGCIRMRNEDVTDLYSRVPVGAKVIVI